MDLERLRSTYPNISVEELYPEFPRIPLTDYPELRDYSWEECHMGFLGAGGLFLTVELARLLHLSPGMNVLDLCCGNCSSSIFLARHFGVNVVAADLEVDPDITRMHLREAGVADQVTPVRMDATNLLLPEHHFDAVFCMNSYFYFGTEPDYLAYLVQFLKSGGRIGIASPCYSTELAPDTPSEFLYDAPEFTESNLVHSPLWWGDHFAQSGVVTVRVCEENPRGREFWLDDVRWLLESTHPRERTPEMREMVLQQIVMLLADRSRFVTYLTLVAEKRRPE